MKKGCELMSVYKDTKQGTWYVSFRYEDWKGEKKQKLKRGFRTKKRISVRLMRECFKIRQQRCLIMQKRYMD